jgi:hypothetical protein
VKIGKVLEQLQDKAHLTIEWAAVFNFLQAWEAYQKEKLARLSLIATTVFDQPKIHLCLLKHPIIF